MGGASTLSTVHRKARIGDEERAARTHAPWWRCRRLDERDSTYPMRAHAGVTSEFIVASTHLFI